MAGGKSLEDISAPRCFEVERRLRELLDLIFQSFRYGQHGNCNRRTGND
jgi:malate dehydrogenase (oxaloacetate-decarboxylating)